MNDETKYIYVVITTDAKKHEIVAPSSFSANLEAERLFGYRNISVAPQDSLRKPLLQK